MSDKETILARRQRLSMVPRAQAGLALDNRPKTDRVSQLEENVQGLEERLAKLEGIVTRPELAEHTPEHTPGSTKAPSASTSASSGSKLYAASSVATGSLYEGSSSFINQSVQASQVAQRTASSETPEAAPTISESFSHLDALLRSSTASSLVKEHQFTNNAAPRPLPPIEPLPASFVIAAVQRVKATPAIFLSGYALNDVSLVENLCQRVYFPTEPVSLGHITSVNGILAFLSREFTILQQPLGKEFDMEKLTTKCERNFNLGIETYDVLAVPSFENVLSLALGVVKAQSETRPMLCCTLLASAASHCQMLGYHRESTYQRDRSGRVDAKRRLFWTLYVFDKNVSLLLGHASKFQDFDIDAQYPALSADPGQRPWDEWFHLAIRLAKVQGQIYNGLYSAGALRTTPTERKQCTESLALEMNKWRADLDALDASRVNYPDIFNLSRYHWDIMYYSTLTSLLRAPATPGMGAEISSQCFQAARLGLHSHLRCFSGYQASGVLSDADFDNWVLHNSSFIPFIAIFLHAIASSSLDDVALLEQVTETLKRARKGHAGSEKLFQICATFTALARRMVEARNSCVGTYDQTTDSLQIAGISGDMPLSWSEVLVDPSSQQIDADDLYGWEDNDMSSILADWINGQPPAADVFGMDFG
ncbi:hypothetical protein ACJZ2D_015362 [Fusarium nematophilum]